jgi:hypothetical protein
VQEAEFVAFWVGQDVPAFGAGLADVGGPGAESEQPLQLGVLVAVGGVDVDVQPGRVSAMPEQRQAFQRELDAIDADTSVSATTPSTSPARLSTSPT